jgi:hypothetical protein
MLVWYGDVPLKRALGRRDDHVHGRGLSLCSAFRSWLQVTLHAEIPRQWPVSVHLGGDAQVDCPDAGFRRPRCQTLPAAESGFRSYLTYAGTRYDVPSWRVTRPISRVRRAALAPVPAASAL